MSKRNNRPKRTYSDRNGAPSQKTRNSKENEEPILSSSANHDNLNDSVVSSPTLPTSSFTQVAPYRIGMEEICGLIPEFRPGSLSNLSASQWISHIENLRQIYGWEERMTLLYATLRLKDAAQFWYQSRQTVNDSWADFKGDLISGFPSDIDEASIHAKLIARKRKPAEPIENYFYEVCALAKRGRLSEETTRKYIISGLGDHHLLTVLTASSCKNNIELLAKIKQYEGVKDQEKSRGINFERSVPQPFKPVLHDRGNNRYNQSARNRVQDERGRHRNNWASRSSQFTGNCFKCGLSGHKSFNCFRRQQSSRPNVTKNMSLVVKNNSNLVQTILVDGRRMEAFIDLGSEWSTIRSRDCKSHNWEILEGEITLKGFAGGVCTTFGRITKKVKIGEVELPLEIAVVPDDIQQTQMIIGQNFTDRQGVKIVKSGGKLQVLREDDQDKPSSPSGVHLDAL